MTALYVFCGLPGSGKTTLSRRLAGHLGATYLRIDTIESGLITSTLALTDVMDAGYSVAWGLATDALALGKPVVADAVHWNAALLDPWSRIASAEGAPCHLIEVTCALPDRQARLAARHASGWKAGEDWQAVLSKTMDPIPDPAIRVDTTNTEEHATFATLLAELQQVGAT
ncbi:MAG: ATP-binding protein [Pseudomonadota bacterium]